MKCEATPPLINVFIDKVLPERKLKHFEEEVIHARFIRFSRFPIIRRRVCINTTPVCNSVRASAFFAQQVVECIMVEKREEKEESVGEARIGSYRKVGPPPSPHKYRIFILNGKTNDRSMPLVPGPH